LIMC